MTGPLNERSAVSSRPPIQIEALLAVTRDDLVEARGALRVNRRRQPEGQVQDVVVPRGEMGGRQTVLLPDGHWQFADDQRLVGWCGIEPQVGESQLEGTPL